MKGFKAKSLENIKGSRGIRYLKWQNRQWKESYMPSCCVPGMIHLPRMADVGHDCVLGEGG